MQFMWEWCITLTASGLVISAHESALRFIAKRCKPFKMLATMLVLALSHVLHIWIFAFAFYATDLWFQFGNIKGCSCTHFSDYVYFSATNYTSLGYGDYIPEGGIRLLGTFEALVGLLMIGWSTAYAFWWMQRHWLQLK